jgi:hypothetical protein
MQTLDDEDDGLEYVFEGVIKNSAVDHVVPHYDVDSSNPRMQLESTTKRAEYTTLYEEQLRHIIEGYDVFHGDEQPISFNSTLATRTKARASNKNMPSSTPTMKHHVEGLFRLDPKAQFTAIGKLNIQF